MPTLAPIYTDTTPEERPDGPKWHIGGKVNHVPLAKCNVLYLGSGAPNAGPDGLDIVQRPLAECFPLDTNHEVEGVNTFLTVFSSGVQMQHEGEKDATWFPIQSLNVCAAVKCVVKLNTSTQQRYVYFAALDSDDSSGSDYPPMFCAVFRRPNSPQFQECHVFIAKSFQAAMALVQSCTHAYDHREGWTDEPPPVDYLEQMEKEKQEAQERQQMQHLKPVDNGRPNAPPEFYKRPPEGGYFYASSKDLVRKYNVADHMTKRGPPPGIRRHPRPPFGPRGPMMHPHGPPMVQPVLVQGPPVRVPVPVKVPVRVPVPVAVPVRPIPRTARMPPPPSRRYFEGWNEFNGMPIAIFPKVAPDEVHRIVKRNRDRKHRKSRRTHSSRKKHRAPRPLTPPARMYHSPQRRRSPRPHFLSDHSCSEDEAPKVINRRSRYEPARRAPPRRVPRERDYAPDFAVYGDMYYRDRYV